jgi:hypothetical protein
MVERITFPAATQRLELLFRKNSTTCVLLARFCGGTECLSSCRANVLEESALAACLGLGIHAVAPQVRLPVLVDDAGRMIARRLKA